jgi:hypothetical protein
MLQGFHRPIMAPDSVPQNEKLLAPQGGLCCNPRGGIRRRRNTMIMAEFSFFGGYETMAARFEFRYKVLVVSMSLLLSLLLFLTLQGYSLPASASSSSVFPETSDWKDQGVVIGPGTGWDKRLSGMLSPCSVINKGGKYYLYYIGADGNRSTDGGPRRRALGVAISTDGVKFEKHSGNPIIEYLPHRNEEEGVFSATALVSENNVFLYYGGMIARDQKSEAVASDIRLATSGDGLDFSDKGVVISHKDSSVWGYGDELFPVGSYKSDDSWNVYYIAKGKGVKWGLGVAMGQGATSFNRTRAVLTAAPYGDTEVVKLADNSVGVLVGLRSTNIAQARRLSGNEPYSLSEPVVNYKFNTKAPEENFALLLDQDKDSWFLYYMPPGRQEIRVMMARRKGSTSLETVPSKPSGLTANKQ